MPNFNWKKHYAIKQQFGKQNSWISESSGIYLWTRYDKDINKTYFYVGQAKNLRNRRFDYYKIQTGLSYPTRHFEASLKAHKDWNYQIIEECEEKDLDEKEKNWIKYYMKQDNFITRNDSLTGSDITKTNANRITKIKKEYEEAIQKCLKHLDVKTISDGVKISMKRTKEGSFTKLSWNAFRTLSKILDLNLEINKENYNEI